MWFAVMFEQGKGASLQSVHSFDTYMTVCTTAAKCVEQDANASGAGFTALWLL